MLEFVSKEALLEGGLLTERISLGRVLILIEQEPARVS